MESRQNNMAPYDPVGISKYFQVLVSLLMFSVRLASTSTDPFTRCRRSPKFSTKTGYNMLRTPKPVIKPLGYTAVQINMVHRHGERYPGNDDMADMMKFAEKINKFNTTISPKVNLKLPWYPPFAGDEDKMLATVGENTLFSLGKRILKRFPELFTKPYNTHNYHFISTCTTRTTGSAASLGMGMFTGKGTLGTCKQQPIHLKVNPCDSDIILKAQDNCPRFEKEVKRNKDATIEVSKFENGPEVKHVIDNIKLKFGQPSMKLSYDEIKMMYEVCAWEISMYQGTLNKGMCSMFSTHELSVIEYNEDMDDYYKRSTGHKISYESSCPLLKDILDTLRMSVRNSSPIVPSGIFRSGHSDTVLPFYALLGVYTNKKPMLASNYRDNRDRIFRGGCLAPFSANFYFVLYKENNGSNHKIQLYVNERLTKIPGCVSSTECDFSTFEEGYREIADKCNYTKMCSVRSWFGNVLNALFAGLSGQ